MMEEYENLENGAPDALSATDATDATTTTSRKLEDRGSVSEYGHCASAGNRDRKEPRVKPGGSQNNKWKRGQELKAKQETRVITRASKNAEATIKKIATK